MSTQKSSNEDREQRILNAASDLIVHFGYDKTTVSDIANEAGISKGAIYLHYKSKDELFEALLIREMRDYSLTWLDKVEADPEGGTIGGMYKNILYALNKSPFMAALFKRDNRILGSYLHKPDNFFRKQQEHNNRFVFVKMMQSAGVMRDDLDANVVAHIMDMLAYSLVSIGEIKNDKFIPPTKDTIETIAEIMDKALTPSDVDSEVGKKVLQELVAKAQQQLKISKEN